MESDIKDKFLRWYRAYVENVQSRTGTEQQYTDSELATLQEKLGVLSSAELEDALEHAPYFRKIDNGSIPNLPETLSSTHLYYTGLASKYHNKSMSHWVTFIAQAGNDPAIEAVRDTRVQTTDSFSAVENMLGVSMVRFYNALWSNNPDEQRTQGWVYFFVPVDDPVASIDCLVAEKTMDNRATAHLQSGDARMVLHAEVKRNQKHRRSLCVNQLKEVEEREIRARERMTTEEIQEKGEKILQVWERGTVIENIDMRNGVPYLELAPIPGYDQSRFVARILLSPGVARHPAWIRIFNTKGGYHIRTDEMIPFANNAHPNVNSGGEMCLDEYGDDYKRMMDTAEIKNLPTLLHSFLEHGHNGNPYEGKAVFEDHFERFVDQHEDLTPERYLEIQKEYEGEVLHKYQRVRVVQGSPLPLPIIALNGGIRSVVESAEVTDEPIVGLETEVVYPNVVFNLVGVDVDGKIAFIHRYNLEIL